MFLEMMLQDATMDVRVQNIYNPVNFDRSLGAVVLKCILSAKETNRLKIELKMKCLYA
jgi:hypothetical protein